ncbi:MAG: class I SAM-dependent methyltransferase [Sulfurifustis sp.]
MSPAHQPPGLPAPSADEEAVSVRLSARIADEIRREGPLPFRRFMELALYAPGLGYYSAGKEKLGRGGDFTTAPEAYPVFGRCVARACAEVLAQLGGDGEILEVGGGSGRLAATVLNELAALDALPRAYCLLDVSASLRARQAETIAAEASDFSNRVRWLDQLPPQGFRGVVLANELLDALPVDRFKVEADGIRELRVTSGENGFAWTEAPAPPATQERIGPQRLAPGYESEIGFAAEAWVRSVAEILDSGVLLLIDYGFPRAEFYHPDRSAGTLMCHYRHRAHTDPLTLVGLQDITAHVDFTAIAEAGGEAGLDLLGYTSQAAFLLGAGIAQIAAASDPNDARAHLSLTAQIKKLTLPHEMGELYKVMALGRGMKAPLSTFAIQDRRGRL